MAQAEEQVTGRGPRRWTAKEVIQGKPIRRPTHPFFVTFPIAFFAGALALDVLGKLGLKSAGLGATYAVAAGLIGAAFAIPTGLVDRSMMRSTSRIRRVATRHMYIQLAATAVFVVDLAVRFSSRHGSVKVLWIVLDVLGTAIVISGGDVGAQMVFRMGYRVSEEAGAAPEAAPAPAAAPTPTAAAPASEDQTPVT